MLVKKLNFKRFPLQLLFATFFVFLIAAGCSNGNTLKRPTSESTSTDNGKVAGTETVALPTQRIIINNIEVNVEVADNDATRSQGLSNRETLNRGNGMLFDFTNSSIKRPGFWMKDMNFNIDIIWIANGKVISITPNAAVQPANETLKVYYPPSDITHVLEVPAGWSTQNKIFAGAVVKI